MFNYWYKGYHWGLVQFWRLKWIRVVRPDWTWANADELTELSHLSSTNHPGGFPLCQSRRNPELLQATLLARFKEILSGFIAAHFHMSFPDHGVCQDGLQIRAKERERGVHTKKLYSLQSVWSSNPLHPFPLLHGDHPLPSCHQLIS